MPEPSGRAIRARRAGPALACTLALAGALAATAAAAVARPDLPDVARRVVALTNEFRAEQGLAATQAEARLAAAADRLATYMAATDRYGHEADGSTAAQRTLAQGYDHCAVAENIAYLMDTRGFTAEALARGFVEGWKNSPGHRRNMLDRDVVDTGVAIAQSPKSQRYYAVQVFGRPRSQALRFSIGNATGREVRYALAGETFGLAPNVTRTHTRCGAALLTVGAGRDALRVETENGARYSVDRDADGRVRLHRDAER
jgi:uncharacterized protein YkwD